MTRLRPLHGGHAEWMCGGPGMVFLYARRSLLPALEPAVTGWFATEDPFSFDPEHLEYHPTARRLEHGTPPAPVFFLAQGGMDIVSEVGVERIRAAGPSDRSRDRAERRGRAGGAHAAGPHCARRGRERAGRRRCRRDLPRAAGPRRMHRLPRRRPPNQSPLLQHGSRRRPLLRRARGGVGLATLVRDGLVDDRARSDDEPDVVERRDVAERALPHDQQVGRGAELDRGRTNASSTCSVVSPPGAAIAARSRARRMVSGRCRGRCRTRSPPPARWKRERLSRAHRTSGVSRPNAWMSSVETQRMRSAAAAIVHRRGARSTGCARARRRRHRAPARPDRRPEHAPSPAGRARGPRRRSP